jgi:hypothetical protein
MNQLHLNLLIFLDLISWGHYDCITDPKVRYERTAFVVSKELPSFVDRWHKPPRTCTSHDPRACATAEQPLEQFASVCVAVVIEDKLEAIKPLFLPVWMVRQFRRT